jgi:hypothetical protein
MYTRFGPSLNPDEFTPPFDEVVEELVQKGRSLHELLRDYMQPRWKNRSLKVIVVDSSELNAYAAADGHHDSIYIFRGTLERLYGTILGLLSTPSFLPAIGSIHVEVVPENLPANGFPPVPLLRNASNADECTPVFFPNDQTRMDVGAMMVDLALEFLIYHEIGHVVGGHLEIPRSSASPSTISEFARPVNESDACIPEQVLECDADAFACHVTSWVHTRDAAAQTLCHLGNSSESRPKDFALVTFLVATGTLFRVLYPTAPVKISQFNSTHPHPAVRACLVASSAMAWGVFDGNYTATSLNDIVATSVGNLEDVWADLYLPGQNPEPGAAWGQSVAKAAIKLFESYGNSKSLLDQYARIPRRWNNWQWPETKERN